MAWNLSGEPVKRRNEVQERMISCERLVCLEGVPKICV